MTTHINIVDGNSGRLSGDGWEFTRIATVSGLSSAGPQQVIDAVVALGVAIGEGHPQVPAAKLTEVTPEQVDQGIVKLRLTYKQDSNSEDDETVIEVGAAVQSVQTNKDINGDLMTVSYNSQSQPGFVSVYRPQVTIRVERQEDGSPGDKAKEYVGKVASAGWDLDPTAADREWLCTSLIGRSRDKGVTYTVNYEFAFKEGNWDAEVVYIDPTTGRAPADIVDGTGIKQFQVYETVDFNGLEL